MPKVTVIVPCYNVVGYVDRCLSSVVRQSFVDYELVLIDDGSTDDTLKKCVEWKRRDGRIILVSRHNAGLGAARNLGISIARGEYVTFLDADDWWREDYLDQMLRGAQSGQNDLVICDFNFVNEGDGETKTQRSILRLPGGAIKKPTATHLLSRARTQACGKLYRRDLFTENNVQEPHHAYEDVATTPYLVAKASSIYRVPEALYFYVRNREGSIINHFPSLDDLLLSLAELAERFKVDNLFNDYYHQLRRIFWGELCFLHRMLNTKFAAHDEEKASTLRCECERIVYDIFPELEDVAEMRFYVGNDDLLSRAVGCIVLRQERIIRDVSDLRKSDIAVSTNKNAIPEDFDGEVLRMEMFVDDKADSERLMWDLADDVFDMVFGEKKTGV